VSRKKLVAGLGSGVLAGIVIALVLLNVGVPLAQPNPGAETIVFNPIKEIRKNMVTKLRVWKNGELIYEGKDPISNIWLYLIARDLFMVDFNKFDGKLLDVEGEDKHGGLFRMYPTYNYLSIHLGDGSSASVSDYRIGHKLIEYDIPHETDPFIINDNGTHLNVTVTTTYTSDDSYTLSEVGLIAKIYSHYDYKAYVYSYLVAHDVFPSVSINSGDSLTFAWIFVAKYNDPPLTKKFWLVLFDNFLNIPAYRTSISGFRIENGSHNNADHHAKYMLVTDNVEFSSDLTMSNFTYYTFTDPITENEIGYSVGSDSELHITAQKVVGVSVSNVYGVGYVIHTENAQTDQCEDLLLAYWYFGSPRNVNADDVLRVEIAIDFNA